VVDEIIAEKRLGYQGPAPTKAAGLSVGLAALAEEQAEAAFAEQMGVGGGASGFGATPPLPEGTPEYHEPT